MGSCKYGSLKNIQYTDEDTGLRVSYQCPVEALPHSDVCMFHDHEGKNRDNEKINHAFLELLKEFSSKNKQLLAIGFKLEKLDFPKKTSNKILFEHAILTDINFDGVLFSEDIVFSYARLSNVSFYKTKFEKKAYFIYTRFQNKVSFRDAKFYDESNFNLAEFDSEADFQSSFFGDRELKVSSCLSETRTIKKNALTYFNGTKFLGSVRFDGSHFGRQTLFDDATFKGYALFIFAKFHKGVLFTGAHFDCNTSFNLTEFSVIASFVRANFEEGSIDNRLLLHGAKFYGEADFRNCKFAIIVFNEKIDEDKVTRELNTTKFLQKTDFTGSTFANTVRIFNTAFEADAVFTNCFFSGPIYLNYVSFKKTFFDSIDFKEEIDFDVVSLPTETSSILVDFSHSTFRKRVRFNGTVHNPIDLSSVSLRGVDLTYFEFNYVFWTKTHNVGFLQRIIIVDELLLDVNGNFEDVIKIYNQLRKNYESKLLFNEAAHFFVGEMESRRKWLKSRSRRGGQGIATFYHNSYRALAWYGESVSLPLLLWAPLTIIAFTILRTVACQPGSDLSTIFGDPECISEQSGNWLKQGIDSVAAFFPIPFSKNHFDTIEHIIGLPILGAAFIALKRRFERIR